MKEILLLLKEEIKMHPKLLPLDVFKFVYQAVFGPAHLLADKEKMKTYFLNEYETTKESNEVIIQKLSKKYCRVNFSAWKYRHLNPELLFECFIDSIGKIDTVPAKKDTERAFFIEIINYINDNFIDFDFEFDKEKWMEVYDSYDFEKMIPVSHSYQYKDFYLPSYRVVCIDLLNKYNIY